MKVGDDSGWVVRELIRVAPDTQRIYDLHLAKEQAEAEDEAKKEAAEAARQRRLAAARRKKEAEEASRSAKTKADQDAKAAEERANLRVACRKIYQGTIDRKVRDLTVREEEQIKACQALGLYQP